MIIYTLPVEFERKIIVPSKPVMVVIGGKLATIEIGEAVLIEDAEIVASPDLEHLQTTDGKEFFRTAGTIQPNRRGKLSKDIATIVTVWQRRI